MTKTIDVFNNQAGLQTISLSVAGRLYNYDPIHGTVTITQGANSATVAIQTGLTFASASNYGYVIGFNGAYTVNGSPTQLYSATTAGLPASYALMTNPQIFTSGGSFYVFDQDASGNYLSVTGNGQIFPVNPYQFSLNSEIYIINTNVQPNTVVGGNVYTMSAGNTQFLINGVQYTIALKSGSLNGATISGQFNITQGNVVVIENYVYQLDADRPTRAGRRSQRRSACRPAVATRSQKSARFPESVANSITSSRALRESGPALAEPSGRNSKIKSLPGS